MMIYAAHIILTCSNLFLWPVFLKHAAFTNMNVEILDSTIFPFIIPSSLKVSLQTHIVKSVSYTSEKCL
jgi:hypothetical protein